MKNPLTVCALLLSISLALMPQDQERRNISLEDAIAQALKSNLDLQIEMINPEVSQAMLNKSNSIFAPSLSLTLYKNESNSLSTSRLEGGDIVTSGRQSLNFSLSQRIALGGTLQATWSNSRNSTNSTFSSINPSYSSNLNFTLSQPLLKNFGTFYTKKTIYTSLINQERTLTSLRQRLIDIIYAVEGAYWNLVYGYQELELQKQSLRLAQDQLKQSEIQVQVGVSAKMDILTAKAEVANRESLLEQSKGRLQVYQENLRKILDISKEKAILYPTDQPIYNSVPVNFNQLLLEALENRPDIQLAKLDLKNKNIEVKYTRNQLLPDLSINAQYYTTGVGGTQHIYEGGLEGGKEIGTKERSFIEAVKDVVSNLYRNYIVSLSLSVPLSNDSARADYTQAQLALKQSLLQLKNTEMTIYSDVTQLVNDLEAGQKIFEASRIARELQEQKLIAEQKKFSVGLSTDYTIFQFQRDLSQARINELQSLITYNLAISRMSRVLGTTLEKHNLQLADFDRTKK